MCGSKPTTPNASPQRSSPASIITPPTFAASPSRHPASKRRFSNSPKTRPKSARPSRHMSRRRTTAIIGHELRLLTRDPLPIMILVVFPLILMAFLKPMVALALAAHGHPTANGAEQVVPGEAVANGFYIVGMTSFAFFAEYLWTTWDRLRASRATSAEIIVGKALPLFAVSAMQFLVIFAVGVPL